MTTKNKNSSAEILLAISLSISLGVVSGCDTQTTNSIVQEEQTNQNTTNSAEPAETTINGKYSAATPEEALQHFFGGIFESNFEKALSGIVIVKGVEQYLKANIAVNEAMNRFAKEDAERFGEEKAFPVNFLAMRNQNEMKTKELVQVDETHALWQNNPKSPLKILRTDEGWKVDMTSEKHRQVIILSTSAFQDTAKVYDELTRRMKANEFASRDEVRPAMTSLKNKYGL